MEDKPIPGNKIVLAMVITIMLFICLVLRIGWIQFINGAELKELASRQQTLNKIISPKRGTIYDASGKTLARSTNVDTITINPDKIVVEHEEEEVEKIKTAEYKKKVARRASRYIFFKL